MHKTPFNDGWLFTESRPSLFETLLGGPEPIAVSLPHDAMLAGGRTEVDSGGSHTGYFRPGAWRYEKHFDVPVEWEDRRVTIEFEGVYRDALVYVNGAFAGQRPNGYSTFRIAIDPFIRYGTVNTIRVDAQAREDSRWYSGGGIYRPVALLVSPLVHIDHAGPRVTTPQVESDLAATMVTTGVVNESTSTRYLDITTTLRDGSDRVVAADASRMTIHPGESLVARQRMYVEAPQLWSADHPTLYSAEVVLSEAGSILDESTVAFGIRTLSLDTTHGLRVNGVQVKLRGACIHHDNGILGAATFPDAEERRVRRLKDAGFNAIRSSHNPMSVAMLDACDRLGMFVMDETFDMWTSGKSNDDYSLRFPEWWMRDVESMIEKDFNHPSVIFYSIGNEILEIGDPHGARVGRQIAEHVRALDGTRFVTNAINGAMAAMDIMVAGTDEAGGFNAALGSDSFMTDLVARPEVGDRIMESASVLDVVGLNYGDSRYLMDHVDYPNRVVVGSETFPSQIDRLWQLVMEHGHVIGDFTWTGWDYLGEAGIGRPKYAGDAAFAAPFPWLTAGCGDIDIIGNRRPVSFYREIVFGLRDEPYMCAQRPRDGFAPAAAAAWSWTDTLASWTWDVEEGMPITVECYTRAEEVAFELNGVEIERVRVGEERRFVARAAIPYKPGVLEAVAYDQGEIIGHATLRTATEPAQIELIREAGPSRSLEFVEVRVLDQLGTLNPAADQEITVHVGGGGRLAGLGAARPYAEESFLDSTCTTYDGLALVAVVRDKTGDDIEIALSAESGIQASAVLTGANNSHEPALAWR